MCGATCPLVEDLLAGDLDLPARGAAPQANAARAGGGGRGSACPALHGIAVLDADGIVRFCNEGTARLFGAEPEALNGVPVSALIPELKLRTGTPGYNIAYALFWFPEQQWRQVEGRGRDGQAVLLDLSISAAKINGRHQLLVAVRRARAGRSIPLAHVTADTDCSSSDASLLQQLALRALGERESARFGHQSAASAG